MTATAPATTGMTVLDLAQAGRFEEIHDLFAPPLRAMVPAEALQAAWASEITQRGPVTAIGEPVSEPAGPGGVLVKIPVSFERGEVTVIISLADAGWLTGIQLAPASAAEPAAPWQPPDYADPAAFGEQDVTVGSGPLAVPGTLTLPRQGGPWPAVVLLGGSGPVDRDETVGRNKPFKDLAWGLASRGVAVLRFDKVTYAHGAIVAQDRGFTVADEYLPQATAAIHLLRGHPGIDAGRIVVAGHSLGGTVAPRVAAAEPSVAGLVILAGGTQPVYWAAVRQVRYLASLNPATAAASESAVAAMTRQARRRSTAPICRPPLRTATCPSACPRPTGWTCAGTTRPRPPRRWTSQSSSSRAAATTRRPSPRTSRAGRPAWPAART
jgi:predicted alpha/beta-hydrolase family hydrolase